eukprot:13718-Heterococcus_DN1.PRE.5
MQYNPWPQLAAAHCAMRALLNQLTACRRKLAVANKHTTCIMYSAYTATQKDQHVQNAATTRLMSSVIRCLLVLQQCYYCLACHIIQKQHWR